MTAALAAVTRRGTTNTNERGSSYARRARREWLLDTYRADKEAVVWKGPYEMQLEPACRCYRCGVLLTIDTVTVDRIIPGCKGGTYRRNNIRPACGSCNSSTGAKLAKRTRRNAA